jgi:hypothetical protein
MYRRVKFAIGSPLMQQKRVRKRAMAKPEVVKLLDDEHFAVGRFMNRP